MTLRPEPALATIRARSALTPEVGIILGSGMGYLAERIQVECVVPYEELPGLPASTVEGHTGRLVLGTLEGRAVCSLDGRFHYYEGYTMAEVAAGVRLLHQLGTRILLLTNAAGSVNRRFAPGRLMIVSDHLNFMWRNPLVGRAPDEIFDMFPDMSAPYDPELRRLLRAAGLSSGIPLVEGVYAGVSGPSYETPAEIELLRRLGADAVGMSTVPEVIAARERGLRVAAVSCLTNYATGLSARPPDHAEVLATAASLRPDLEELVAAFLRTLPGEHATSRQAAARGAGQSHDR